MAHDSLQDSGGAIPSAPIAPDLECAERRSGSCLDPEDLEQVEALARLEAGSVADRLPPEQRNAYIESRVATAVRAEIARFGDRLLEPVDAVELIVDERDERPVLPTVPAVDDMGWFEAADELASRQAAVDHVRRVLGRMPEATVEVVRLRYGMDGGEELAPSAVAQAVGLPATVVRRHLAAAELLFRHFDPDRRRRRVGPLSGPAFAAFRRLGDLAAYDLRGLNLNNADLRRCDLSDAVLAGVNLWGARLSEACLSRANLWGAQLEGGDLHGASLDDANLERVGLAGADLADADLASATLWGAELGGAVLAGATLCAVDLRAAGLAGADLTGADLRGADLRGADLRGAVLVGANLSSADLRGAMLEGADVRWADLQGTGLGRVDVAAAGRAGGDGGAGGGVGVGRAVRRPGVARSRRVPAPQAPASRRLRPLESA